MASKGVLMGLVGGVLLLAGAGTAGVWWWLGQSTPDVAVKAPDKPSPKAWQEGFAGFLLARSESEQSGIPLLYLVERNPGHCFYCKQLHQALFDNPEMKAAIAPFIKISLNPDANNNSQQAIAQLPEITSYPAMFMQLSPQGPLLPLKVVVQAEQIWVPREDYMKGNFMPLSPASLTLAIDNTRKLLAATPTR
ncbi:hypothetical protein [Aeromonas schubertii]|uniref:Thioredoxin-like fold domain-containing protein n=1 Tax=Aeromonas schubertii TaxID=652 RepID=A0A0S2SLX9_9GAMM|nr:hypothetical protein [Aeromonas schubertii]ALP42642.1 hypothetical protein WL1483_3223 [Aeromonas schubertii]KUE79669.1 hypothetical protein ATO46_18545 [Aeromonas schubertii]MBZ6065314.1 hypothetical protein [Aeromonas schubertii]MBZ6072430.1 hypothetical protein [Aeromonas schubertii]QCG49318.1 hypothetical protein E2P79_17120 [Aeromonas schubertii]